MAAIRVTREADDRAARALLPVRREQPRERGHDVDVAVVGHRARERLDLRARTDQTEVVAQPLHERASDRDRALERVVHGPAAETVRDGRDEPRGRRHGRRARVHQHEAAGAVRVLRLAGREARLARERGLLIAEDSGERDARERRDLRVGVDLARRRDPRQHRARHVERREQRVVPVAGRKIHELRAARVRDVRDVQAARGAAREVPGEPRVDRAEQRVAGRRLRARVRHLIEQPFELQRAEVRRERQPGRRAEPVSSAVARVGRDEVRDARVLPDERVVQRPPRAAIPEHGRLALIRDPDRREIGRVQALARERAADHLLRVAPDLDRVVLDPAGARIDLCVLLLCARDDRAGGVEHDEAAARRALIDRSDEPAHWHSSAAQRAVAAPPKL